MALYLLFKNKNTLLFIYIFCLLFKLQMCQIILTDPVYKTMFQKILALLFILRLVKRSEFYAPRDEINFLCEHLSFIHKLQ